MTLAAPWARTILLSALPILLSCDAEPSYRVPHALDTILEIDRQRTLIFASFLPVEAEATAGHEISLVLDADFIASSSVTAQTAADEFDFEVEYPDESTILIVVPAPDGARYEGVVRLTAPPDLAVALESTGTVIARGFREGITVLAGSGILVERVRGDISAATRTGGILVDAELSSSDDLIAQTGSGDITLLLPRALSARFTVNAGMFGDVVVSHPELPAPSRAQKNSYEAEVNGGLSDIQAFTQSGRITLSVRGS